MDTKNTSPSTPGKLKPEKYHPPYSIHRIRLSKLTIYSSIFLALIIFFFILSPPSPSPSSLKTHNSWGGPAWEKRVTKSARRTSASSLTVLVTGASGFVGTHVSLALKRRGDGVIGLDNFNRYYDPNLKRARQKVLSRAGVFVVEGDINDANLLHKFFDVVPFTHVMHLAAQDGVCYAMQNPYSYIHSNIAGFVTLLEASKSANPQPAIVYASSSSVYGLNSKVPFSEKDRTDQPTSLYAATKKAGEEIAHAYNHIYGLSVTGLRFFTVYGLWGRPDMAYYFFTKDILKGKHITVFESPDGGSVARDFTYIDDIVKGCLGAFDTAKKRKKKTYTKPKKIKHKHRKVKLAVLQFYKVDDSGKVQRLRKECPNAECGAGTFMANHFDRHYCGKCGLTYVYQKAEA